MTNTDKLEELVPKMYEHTTIKDLQPPPLPQLLSGQEWYTKYLTEIAKLSASKVELLDFNDFMDTAMKVSGL